MPYGSGKFEGEPASTYLLWHASLDGGAEQEAGDVETIGWFGLMRGPFEPATDEELGDAWAAGYTNAETFRAHEEMTNKAAGAILSSDNYGFVSCKLYDTAEELERDWAEIETEAAKFEDSEV